MDIVERLRDEAFGGTPDSPCITKVRYLTQAADEIERLREHVELLDSRVTRLMK